ncbi:hypothetical protein M434DRAFT_378086 [Hypoxylon sp. CO27-5]|nr:hypothetical protein M434DRAFT_378086 [Hypoxylon sp. CO27-5]
MYEHRSKEELSRGVTKPKLLRQLSNNEMYQLAMYTLDQYHGTSVSCRYEIPPHLVGVNARPQLVNIVESAISSTVLEHPILQVGIADADSKKPSWIQLDCLNLNYHVTWRILDRSSDFEDSLAETTASQLDATYLEIDKRPGWRIVVLYQDQTNFLEILFTWSHPHADGISGKIFHDSLYQNFNTDTKQQNLEGHTLKLPESALSLPPPIEKVIKLPVDLSYALKTLWQEFRPPFFWRDPSLAHWAPIRISPYKTQYRVFTVENHVLSKLLTACRKRKATITSLFHGLALVSLASNLEEKTAPAFQSFTAVNLRRFMPSNPPHYLGLLPDRTMGNYVTLQNHKFSPVTVAQIRSGLAGTDMSKKLPVEVLDHMWSTATAIRAEIVQKLKIGVKNDHVGLMKFVGDWRVQMTDTAQRPRQCSWFVTNLGVLDAIPNSASDQSVTWSIRRAQFAVSAETTQAALMISIMTVAEGRLCVTCSWQDCIFDTSFGEHVVADLERWVVQLGSD